MHLKNKLSVSRIASKHLCSAYRLQKSNSISSIETVEKLSFCSMMSALSTGEATYNLTLRSNKACAK